MNIRHWKRAITTRLFPLSISGVMIAAMRSYDDPSHWNLVSLTIGVLGLALAGLLVYAGAHFVLW